MIFLRLFLTIVSSLKVGSFFCRRDTRTKKSAAVPHFTFIYNLISKKIGLPILYKFGDNGFNLFKWNDLEEKLKIDKGVQMTFNQSVAL